ncbi:MAG: hypothetical protein QF805_12755, partial [Pirellulaceae bacterium]|nr:hypothetical protein [Pirellulaceae bacterium]
MSFRTIVAAAFACCFTAGCGGSADMDVPPPPSLGSDGLPIVETEGSGGASQGRAVDFDWSSPISFRPPRPQRANPFSVAKEQTARAATFDEQSSRQSSGPSLMGFVKVREPRALLSVGGKLTSFKEGEQIKNIRMVKIEPPRVTFLHNGSEVTQALTDERKSRQDDEF